jgi:hypothetical protein
MKPIHISLSAGPVLKQEKYTGDAGLYQAATPYNGSEVPLIELAKKLGQDPDPSKLHCTLMYSPKKTPSAEDLERITSTWLEDSLFCLVHHVKSWVGHDKKTYVVVALASISLHHIHGALREAGCESTYPIYEPHITLAKFDIKDVPSNLDKKMEKVNQELATKPVEISLYAIAPSNIVE